MVFICLSVSFCLELDPVLWPEGASEVWYPREGGRKGAPCFENTGPICDRPLLGQHLLSVKRMSTTAADLMLLM